jgi:hypothetical protein
VYDEVCVLADLLLEENEDQELDEDHDEEDRELDESQVRAMVSEREFRNRRGESARAIFWEKEGPGSFFVGTNAASDELVLLRTWVNKAESEDEAKAFVDLPPKREKVSDGVFLRVSDAPIIATYSPVFWQGVLPSQLLEAVEAAVAAGSRNKASGYQTLLEEFRSLVRPATPAKPVMLGSDLEKDLAAALRLLPGTYSVSVGRHEFSDEEDSENDWSCIWCRFKRSTSDAR